MALEVTKIYVILGSFVLISKDTFEETIAETLQKNIVKSVDENVLFINKSWYSSIGSCISRLREPEGRNIAKGGLRKN